MTSSAIDNTPSNRNFLSPLRFTFRIKKAPNVNFFLQKVNVPAIYSKQVNTSNPLVTTPYPGEHLTFDPLKIKFLVDEDFLNYLEIFNWISGLSKPESFEQYRELAAHEPYTGLGIYSDVSIIILNSVHAPNYEVTFTDAFPISLSELEFTATDPDLQYLVAESVFKYTTYSITSL